MSDVISRMQETERLAPPMLTIEQERRAELYSILSDAEDEIGRQMDIRAEARDILRDMGEAI